MVRHRLPKHWLRPFSGSSKTGSNGVENEETEKQRSFDHLSGNESSPQSADVAGRGGRLYHKRSNKRK